MLLHSGSPNRVCALREARLPLPATVGASTDFLHHLFAEDLGRGSPSEAFAGRVVELVAALQRGTTDARRPSSRRSHWPQPSSSGCEAERVLSLVAEVQATGFYSIAELAFVGSMSSLSRRLCGRKMQMVGALVASCSNT